MRGAFNKVCNLFYGPESPYGTPGVQYAASLPCRFVPQPLIEQDDFPLVLTDQWLTIGAVAPNTPKYESLSLGQWQARIYTADLVSVVGVTLGPWFAIRREVMSGPAQAPYWRVALLLQANVQYPDWLPPSPPPPPPPGPACASATAIVVPSSRTEAIT
ncbi:hypothetical protein B7486_61205, partial [cyanobacterium TDX16]